MIEATKELVQSLNDGFSQAVEQALYSEKAEPAYTQEEKTWEIPAPVTKEKPKAAPFFPPKNN